MVEKEDCGECGSPVLQVPSTRLALKKTYEKQCCLCDSVKKFHSFCVRQVVPRYHALDYPIDKWCKEVDDSFYCFNCRTKCFMCSQTHNYTDNKSRRIKCSGCSKKNGAMFLNHVDRRMIICCAMYVAKKIKI